MKILKSTLIIVLFSLVACTTDHNTTDVIDNQNKNVIQEKSNTEYSLEEILSGIRLWDNIRSNEEVLLSQFEKYNSLNLNMELFPQGNALHAYACVIDGELKFAMISEVYDNATYKNNIENYIQIVDVAYKDITDLRERTYENHNFSLPTQYIQSIDAISRIEDWNANYSNWLSTDLPVYQSFTIPTYSLVSQNYTVYFGLKYNSDNPIVKEADLVLDSNKGAFYDTVLRRPPYPDSESHYILELL